MYYILIGRNTIFSLNYSKGRRSLCLQTETDKLVKYDVKEDIRHVYAPGVFSNHLIKWNGN